MSPEREGERIRIAHAITRMQSVLASVATAEDTPIGTDMAQAVVITAFEIAMQIARHDAFEQAERIQVKPR